jgi:hypothetical protein
MAYHLASPHTTSIRVGISYSTSASVGLTSVAEPHHFYAALAPAPGKNFDAAPTALAPAPAPTLLYSKAKFLK